MSDYNSPPTAREQQEWTPPDDNDTLAKLREGLVKRLSDQHEWSRSRNMEGADYRSLYGDAAQAILALLDVVEEAEALHHEIDQVYDVDNGTPNLPGEVGILTQELKKALDRLDKLVDE